MREGAGLRREGHVREVSVAIARSDSSTRIMPESAASSPCILLSIHIAFEGPVLVP